MKCKNKSIKIVVCIISLILLIVLIHFGRNYIILSKIEDKQKNFNENNYSYTTTKSNGDIIKYSYKDGISIFNQEKNGENTIKWSNLKTRESIYINPNELKSTVVLNDEALMQRELPHFIEKEQKNYYTLISFIGYDNIDGKECYKIISGSVKSYVDKNDGTIIKIEEKKDKKTNITEFKDYKFNELTDDDIVRPDLTGYNIENK